MRVPISPCGAGGRSDEAQEEDAGADLAEAAGGGPISGGHVTSKLPPYDPPMTQRRDHSQHMPTSGSSKNHLAVRHSSCSWKPGRRSTQPTTSTALPPPLPNGAPGTRGRPTAK